MLTLDWLHMRSLWMSLLVARWYAWIAIAINNIIIISSNDGANVLFDVTRVWFYLVCGKVNKTMFTYLCSYCRVAAERHRHRMLYVLSSHGKHLDDIGRREMTHHTIAPSFIHRHRVNDNEELDIYVSLSRQCHRAPPPQHKGEKEKEKSNE